MWSVVVLVIGQTILLIKTYLSYYSCCLCSQFVPWRDIAIVKKIDRMKKLHFNLFTHKTFEFSWEILCLIGEMQYFCMKMQIFSKKTKLLGRNEILMLENAKFCDKMQSFLREMQYFCKRIQIFCKKTQFLEWTQCIARECKSCEKSQSLIRGIQYFCDRMQISFEKLQHF